MEIANRLFSITNTTGSLWIAAKLTASWKSPGLVAPSPPYVNTTRSSLRTLIASAIPAACGNCVAMQTEPVTMFASGELNWFTTCRPAEFGSVALANTPRNWSFAVWPRTSATPTSR